jgi:hypothetical protein
MEIILQPPRIDPKRSRRGSPHLRILHTRQNYRDPEWVRWHFGTHARTTVATFRHGRYSGKEIKEFLAELVKGNPVNLEPLFTDPARSAFESREWSSLRALRHQFVTQRAVDQCVQRGRGSESCVWLRVVW